MLVESVTLRNSAAVYHLSFHLACRSSMRSTYKADASCRYCMGTKSLYVIHCTSRSADHFYTPLRFVVSREGNVNAQHKCFDKHTSLSDGFPPSIGFTVILAEHLLGSCKAREQFAIRHSTKVYRDIQVCLSCLH